MTTIPSQQQSTLVPGPASASRASSSVAPVVLAILDGWGYSHEADHNAIRAASTPVMDALWHAYPHTLIEASGAAVGLPDHQMGNSEVGHTNIGAGRVVAMDLGQIDLAIEEGSFAVHPPMLNFIAAMKDSGGAAHLMGLVSDGGVHGHIAHMIAAVKALDAAGVPVVIHALTDGRDVAPQSVLADLAHLEKSLPETVRIVTLTGRYYAMDRDNRWDRVALAHAAIANGDGAEADSAKAA